MEDTTLDWPHQTDSSRILILGFHHRLLLGLAAVPRGDEYYLGDLCLLGTKRYLGRSFGGFADFSDWLRNPSGQVIGIRFWPYEEMRFLGEYLCHFPYALESSDGKRLEVYFSRDRRIDEDTSVDQDFATNKVYSTEAGEYAIAIGASHLTALELEGVYAADADWEPASIAMLPQE